MGYGQLIRCDSLDRWIRAVDTSRYVYAFRFSKGSRVGAFRSDQMYASQRSAGQS